MYCDELGFFMFSVVKVLLDSCSLLWVVLIMLFRFGIVMVGMW